MSCLALLRPSVGCGSSGPVPVWGPAGLLGTLGPAVGCCLARRVLWEPAVVWLLVPVEGERDRRRDRQAWGPVCGPAPLFCQHLVAEARALPVWGLQMELRLPCLS